VIGSTKNSSQNLTILYHFRLLNLISVILYFRTQKFTNVLLLNSIFLMLMMEILLLFVTTFKDIVAVQSIFYV